MTQGTGVHFSDATLLWLLWLLPLLGSLYWIAARKRRAALARFAEAELMEHLVPQPSTLRAALRPVLVSVALIGIVVAAAGPRWGFQWEEVHRRGVDVVVALDLSRSMLAEDAKPNRLTVAKREIRDLLDLLQGDRIALVAFAGTSFVQCPLTLDYGAFEVFLEPMDPNWVPVGGTDLAAAVRSSIDAFPKNERSGRAVLLITDGEDHSGELQDAAEEAREAGVHVFVVGIGEPGGAPVPDGRGGFVKENGRVVLTKLDEPALKELALTTKGTYVRSAAGDLDLRKIYLEDIRGALQARELSSSRQRRWEERYQLALLPALLLLLLEGLIGPPRRRARRSEGKHGATLGLFLALGLSIVWPSAAEASWFGGSQDPIQAGYQSFKGGEFQAALDHWIEAQVTDPNNAEIDYNIGQAHYRLGNYPEAEKAFQAAAVSDVTELSADASFNAGNAAFQQGRYPEAIAHYEQCLELRAEDEDATLNRDLAQRRYEELLEQAKNDQEKREQEEQQQDQEQPQQDDAQADEQEPGEEAEPGEDGQQQNKKEQQDGQAGQQQEPPNEEQESGDQQQDDAATEEEQEANQGGQAAAADIDREAEPPGEEPAAEGAVAEQTEETDEPGDEQQAIIEGALSPEQAKSLLDALEADQRARRQERTKREGQRGRKAARKDW